MKRTILFFAVITASQSYAQDSSVKVTGYLETYYGYDFNTPEDNNRPAFIYSHSRHNEVTLNLGFVKAAYENGSLRANLALMAGTYSNSNLAAEPGVLKNILEANAGIKLSNKSNLWLDAGILSSHIGFESALSKDCWVLTRNISSENTPYYESGVKLSYSTADGTFYAAGLFLNGWQRIQRQDGNSRLAGGIQLSWKPAAFTLNYSNYLGTEGADEVRVRRFYNNFYGIFPVTENLGLTVGFDYGLQQTQKGSKNYDHIISPVAILRYQLAETWAAAGRVEYYKDENGMIIPSETPSGFSTTGYSLNIDYAPFPNALVRLEGKVYDSKDKVFVRNADHVDYNCLVTTSIAVSF